MTSEAPAVETKTVGAWKARKRHEVTLPSGQKVKIELPNLATMLKTGQIPNDLVAVAIKKAANKEIDEEMVPQADAYRRFMVLAMVKEPEIKEDDLDELPEEDLAMLNELASRQRDMDAVGHHLGGLETDDDFRKFRGLDSNSAASIFGL